MSVLSKHSYDSKRVLASACERRFVLTQAARASTPVRR